MKSLFFLCFFIPVVACVSRHHNESNPKKLDFPTYYVTNDGTRAKAASSALFAPLLDLEECSKKNVRISKTILPDSIFGQFSISYTNHYDTVKKYKMYPEEHLAVLTYSGSLFGAYNFAASGTLGCEAVSPLMLSLVSALNKLPEHSGTVYSAQSFAMGDALKKLKPGEIFVSEKFISSSTDETVSKSFLTTKPEKEGVLFTIKNPSGKDITKFAILESEQEILFKPGVHWKVESPPTRVKAEKPYWSVTVTDVSPRVTVDDDSPSIESWSQRKVRLSKGDSKIARVLVAGVQKFRSKDAEQFSALTDGAKVAVDAKKIKIEWELIKTTFECETGDARGASPSCEIRYIGYEIEGVSAILGNTGALFVSALESFRGENWKDIIFMENEISVRGESSTLDCYVKEKICFVKTSQHAR